MDMNQIFKVLRIFGHHLSKTTINPREEVRSQDSVPSAFMITLIELLIVFGAIFMGVRHGSLAFRFLGRFGLSCIGRMLRCISYCSSDRRCVYHFGCLHVRSLYVEAVGGLETFFVRIAARIIRAKPKWSVLSLRLSASS